MLPAQAKDVAIVTPWYPTREQTYRGAFVRAMVDATAPRCDRVTVFHCDPWVAPLSEETDPIVRQAHGDLFPHILHRSPTVGGADLAYVPVPMPRGQAHAEIALRSAASLRTALGGRPIDAPVVHAHVGLPGGWAALTNARLGARVFVTEHASYLDRVLAEPAARRMYDEMLYRCTGFFAVGEAVRAPLDDVFPHHAERIKLIPNPISFDLPRASPVTELRRWLFLGALSASKGVDWLLEAFAKCRTENPTLTLTLVGEGELRGRLIERAAELGVSGAVTFTGAVAPDEALRLMREHDLLVHPSRKETFGMTVVEAVAAGLPILVTRCGGPEATLAGMEAAVGELISIEDNAESIIDGYRRLQARFPNDLDLQLARRELASRYSYQSVAEAHHRIWFPEASG